MKILFLTGREIVYPLNQTLLHSLRKYNQVDVIDEKGSGKSIIKRSAQVLAKSLSRLRSNKYDLIFVGFFGHFIVPAVRAFTKTPILFHPFISTYETLIFDRKKASNNSLAANLSFALDNTACHAASSLLLDTQANVTYFSDLFHIPNNRFSVVFIGSDERLFYPRLAEERSDYQTVLYHGSFLPLQGIDVIIKAAQLLKDKPHIRFQLLGGGLEFKRIYQLVNDLGLSNVEFVPAVPLDKLPDQIAKASICLGGHFGTSDKAARVIAGKTFQDIAMGKATIVGDNEANSELLTHGHDAWFCPMDNAQELANGINNLVNNSSLRRNIGENAHRTFLERASLKVLNPQIQQVAEKAACMKNLSED